MSRLGISGEVPPFVPHPWLSDAHLQTVIGRYLPSPKLSLPSTYHEVEVEDGDRLAVLESIPRAWRPGDPATVLVHGLAGCARSPYVARAGAKLVRLGVRVVRMNLRGAGSGFGLARGTYHAGRSDDLRRVLEWTGARAPGSPMGLVGYSLGGNLALKLAAEASETPVLGLDCVIAANPPIDLALCSERILERQNRIYDRNFVKLLRAEVERLHAHFPELGPVTLPQRLSLVEFDDWYTAPRNGFSGAIEYYEQSSSVRFIPRITLPGLVIHAEDDPFIPAEPFRATRFPEALQLDLVPRGGHLGYLSREPWFGDRRWLDARLVSWLARRWDLMGNPAEAVS